MKTRPRLLRITTVPISLKLLLRGQLSFFKEQGFDVLAVSADGPEIDSLRQEGIPHKKIHMTRKITPIRDLISLMELVIVIIKFRPHIVHTHTPKAGLLGMLAAWICNTPIRLHTVAGLPMMEARGLKYVLLKLTERLTYRCAHQVYPNSVGLQNYIAANFSVPASKLRVIGKGSTNGIDISFFSRTAELAAQAEKIRQQFQISKDDVVYCFVGRVVRDKGVNELVESFARLQNKIKSVLILVGPFEQDLDPVSEKTQMILNENKSIINVGYQQDVRPFLIASDIFVFPSYREGFPNVVLQACALEIACIVSDINGCNEIITNGETGIVVKPKDVQSLMEAMTVLATDSSLRKKFAQQAHFFVTRNYRHGDVWNLLKCEYAGMLEKRKIQSDF